MPLLETYLDRRQPDWRAHVAGEQARRSGRQAGAAGAMDEATAWSILGLRRAPARTRSRPRTDG